MQHLRQAARGRRGASPLSPAPLKSVGVEKKCVAGCELDIRLVKLSNRSSKPNGGADESIDSVRSLVSRHQQRRMSRADHARPAGRGSSATHIAVMKERAPKMLRKSLFTASMISAGCVVLGAAVMKKQFGQRGQQRRGRAMAGGIRDPKKSSAVAHPQPAINIAADLNDRPITRRHFPARQARRLLRNERLLS